MYVYPLGFEINITFCIDLLPSSKLTKVHLYMYMYLHVEPEIVPPFKLLYVDCIMSSSPNRVHHTV